jgi:biopolymer transport protein ExbD
MIDMMTILVVFLIFSAVFTRTNILELNLPAANQAVPNLPQGLQLEVIVRKDRIEVADRGTGLLKSLAVTDAKYDFVALSQFLQLVKSKYPDKTDASILLEADISYDTLVQTMDTVRVFQTPGTGISYGDLFPDVSVGDAPT